MFEAPLPGTKAGEIIQVSAEGFMLHDRILRPAQVGVSSMRDERRPVPVLAWNSVAFQTAFEHLWIVTFERFQM